MPSTPNLPTVVPVYDIELMRGDGEIYQFTIKLYGTETPVDLTGASIWYTVKRGYEDADSAKILGKTVGDGIVVTDAENGVGEIRFTSADRTALGLKKYLHDLQYQKAGEEPHTVFRGTIAVLGDITHSTL